MSAFHDRRPNMSPTTSATLNTLREEIASSITSGLGLIFAIGESIVLLAGADYSGGVPAAMVLGVDRRWHTRLDSLRNQT
jgi:hypothetical protein